MNDWLAAFPLGFDDLLQSVLASTAAVIVVLALRPLWQRRFGAASALLLWWLVPASLCAVLLPARTEVVEAAATEFGIARANTGSFTATPVVASERIPIEVVFGALWLGGTLLTAVLFIRQQRRFRSRLGQLRTIGPRVLVAEHADAGPAVLGLLQPQIVLPADFAERYDDEQQALILAHDRSHLRRGDLLANAVASTLRCVYWFNPLIHYAADRLRHDHELASDADVLRQFPNSRRRYADTLLNVQLAVPGLPVGCLWQSSHPLKERILMLKNSPVSPALQRLSLAASLAVLAIGAGAAWAAQPVRIATGSTNTIAAATTTAEPTHVARLHALTAVMDSDFEMQFLPGQPFSFTLEESGHRWSIDMTIDSKGAGYELNAKVHCDDRLSGEPRLLLDATGKFAIELGDNLTGILHIDGTIAAMPAPIVANWSAQPVSIKARDLTLRQLVERLAKTSGVIVSGVDVLDQIHPQADMSLDLNETSARTALAVILEKTDVTYTLDDEGIHFQTAPVEEASTAAPSYARLSPPKYPKVAVDAKQSGNVVLRVQVGKDGMARKVEVERSTAPSELDAAAIAAVKTWKFNPAVKDGSAVESTVLVPICFSMDEQAECPAVPEALDGIYITPPEASTAQTGPTRSEAPSDVQPLADHNKPPRYPKAAIDAKQSGEVVLNIMVGADGIPAKVEVASSEPAGVFDEVSLAAAREWRFEPARDDAGKAIASTIKVPLTFDLHDDEAVPAAVN